MQNKRKFILLFYTAFLFFFLEFVLFVALRFTTSYFHALLIIAISLLGLLFGGVVAAAIRTPHLPKAIFLGSLSLLFVAWTGFGGVILSFTHFWTSSVLLGITFTPIGFLIGILYRTLEPWRAYATELLGGVLGFAGALFLIPLIREENALLFAFLVSVGFFAVFYWETLKEFSQKFLVLSLFLFAATLLFTNIRDDSLNLIHIALCRIAPEEIFVLPKITCLKNLETPYTVLRSFGSVVDRFDIVSVAGPDILLAAFSGVSTDTIQPFPREAYIFDARIPSSAVPEQPKVLVIGTGGEGVVKVVKTLGASRITVAELNPAVLKLWKDDAMLKEYARGPLDDVSLEVIDGRVFLETSTGQFDLITMMNTHRVRNVGHFGEPDFLHTKEAFQLLLERLSPGGLLVFEEPNFNDTARRAIENITATLREAMQEVGIQNPSEHVVLYQWTGAAPNAELPDNVLLPYVQFAVKKTSWTNQDIIQLKKWAGEAGRTDNRVAPNNAVFHKWLWLPLQGEGTDGIASSFASVLTGETNRSLSAATVITDLSPFPIALTGFDNVVLWRSLFVFSGILLAAVIWWYFKTKGKNRKARIVFPLYFLLIGFGYMFIEILLLQRFQLYLGSVPLSFISSIAGLLTASALGSWFFNGKKLLTRILFYSAPMLIFVLLLYMLVGLPTLYFESIWLRFSLAFLLAAASGLTLSVFFPYGFTQARKYFRAELPMLVGFNGSAMALGVPLALLVASQWGFFSVAAGVVVLYVLSIVLFRGAQHI